MALLKRLLVYLMSGAVLGAIVASLIAPSFLISQNTTRLTQAQCSCVDITRDTAAALIQWQLVGSAIGATALLVLGVVLTMRGRPRPGAAGAA